MMNVIRIIFLNFIVSSLSLFFVFGQSSQTFAIIGDYGYQGPNTEAVANMVKGWNPDFVVSVGDDNYQAENHLSIDTNCGQYYHRFIGNYTGSYGSGSAENNFFPVLGNADYKGYEGEPSDYLLNQWLGFFTLPNNERYYDYVKGDIHFFALNSNVQEPDGITAVSTQGQWLKQALASSTSKFNIVYMHQTPYSSAKITYKNGHIKHGSNPSLQWPFQEWGADIVFSGDDHFYERNVVSHFTYVIIGIGGRSLTDNDQIMSDLLPGITQVHYNEDYGAILAEALPNENRMIFKVYNKNKKLIDEFSILINKAQWRSCN